MMSTLNPQPYFQIYFVLKTRVAFYTLIHNHYYYFIY